MSVRDEIARALHRADTEPRRFDRDWIVHEWDEISDEAREYWYRLAGALLPIIERAVREAAIAGWAARVFSERGQDYESTDAIVARVMEGGQ